MTSNLHDYQMCMKRTKTSVVLIVLEYVLFPARFILFLFITICSTWIRDKDILICILDHHAWKSPWNFKINPLGFPTVTVETIIIMLQLRYKLEVWKIRTVYVRLLPTSVVLFIEVKKTASLQSRGRCIVIIGNEPYKNMIRPGWMQ